MTIPNLITILRLLLVPVVIVAITQGRWDLAFGLFLLAGVSDGIDGWIARRFNQRSELGALMDPLADKALLVSIYVTLAAVAVLPVWLAVLVVFRDLLIVMAILLSWFMDKPMRIKPIFVSKVNTAFQIGFAVLVLATKAFGIGLGGFDDALMLAIAALTVVTAGAYLVRWLRHMGA